MGDDTGERIRALIAPGQTHREIAASVGMTPDAFSRALSGQRGFSAIEIARLADLLGADIHFLITGEVDPLRLRMVARHDFDPETGARQVPGADRDRVVLEDVALAYRQAAEAAVPPSSVPAATEAVRTALGDGFVRPFVDRIESAFGVDVVRLADLSTSYSFTISGRSVILVPADGNWFRQNWSLAHELGHIKEHHTDPDAQPHQHAEHEESANAFAAELLLPAGRLKALDWSAITAADLANRVWDWGISTAALANRLSGLHIRGVSRLVEEWRSQPTQRLLRRHWISTESGDPITWRMDRAATRRFPLPLQEAHLALIASGALPKATLAWMLGVAESALEVDEPVRSDAMSTDDLTIALGL